MLKARSACNAVREVRIFRQALHGGRLETVALTAASRNRHHHRALHT
jgi:hypothetical protein